MASGYTLSPKKGKGIWMKKLGELRCGEEAVVSSIKCRDSIRQRLIEMGMLPGTKIKVMKCAPLGDPIKYQLRGYCLSIRKEDANDIYVKSFYSKKLIPVSMLDIGDMARVETIEVDAPNRTLLESYGIRVETPIKFMKISGNLIKLKVRGKDIALTKSVCGKIFVVRL
jgi:ferrous iron transport protein A